MAKIPVQDNQKSEAEAAKREADAEAAAATDKQSAEADDESSPQDELQAEVDELKRQNQALNEQMLRVRADAENFRKRLQREKDEFARFAREGFIRDLLPVKDNLERAMSHAENDPATIVDGVKLTLEQFDSVLKNMGVEVIECLGCPFDPARHEAMTQMESDEHEPNTVMQELQRGYCLNDRLLRPAMVAVAKAAEKKSEG